MATDNSIPYSIWRFHPLNKKYKGDFYSFWIAEQNPTVSQGKYYVHAFLM